MNIKNKLTGAFEVGKKFFILMEYCEGGDLYDKITDQCGTLFEEEIILDWLSQISAALLFCHERNPKIIHRDIKTSNIFLLRDHKTVN